MELRSRLIVEYIHVKALEIEQEKMEAENKQAKDDEVHTHARSYHRVLVCRYFDLRKHMPTRM